LKRIGKDGGRNLWKKKKHFGNTEGRGLFI